MIIAMLALLGLGGLAVTQRRGASPLDPGLVLAARWLLAPLGLTMIGLGLGKSWARWSALAGAVGVLPWAAFLTFGMPAGTLLRRQAALALAASLALLLSLSGRAMVGHYEGRAAVDWTTPRMGLVRWTIILNLASTLQLFLFLVAYRYTVPWHAVIPAGLLGGLLGGVLLLARQKTAGLLLVALSCVLFVPGGTYFVWTEARHTGEIYLFAALFLPGVLAGWACLFAFGRDLWWGLTRG
ncbi:MAG TPA: hypothetical protein VH764_07765 [Gemmatimonadales bacterium]|jgi:hypothetical protein